MFLGTGHQPGKGFVGRRAPSEVRRRGPPAWHHPGHQIKVPEVVGAGGTVCLHVAGLFWLCNHTDTPFTHSRATLPPQGISALSPGTVTLSWLCLVSPQSQPCCLTARLRRPARSPEQDAISQGVSRTPLCHPGTAAGLRTGAYQMPVKDVHREEGAVALLWVSLRISGSSRWELILPLIMPTLERA